MEENSKDEGVSIVESSSLSNQEAKITRRAVENNEDRDKGKENRDAKEKFVPNGDSGNEVGTKHENLCCVIDVKPENMSLELEGEAENQRVCRIYHLSKWEIGKYFADLIELGCDCKGELGFVHSYCAESWFMLKGNRSCEICSKTATNITGVVTDSSFMEEWNESRLIDTGPFSSERTRGCLFGQPFCNFLLACVVITCLLPWFFHVDLF